MSQQLSANNGEEKINNVSVDDAQISMVPKRTNYLSFTSEPVVKQIYALARIIHKAFTELGINYWTSSGTLLGCVRHRGLIPWDDDLDFCVYQENIDKNEQRLKSLLNDNGCEIVDFSYGYTAFLKTESVELADYKELPYFRYPFCDIFVMERKQGITLIVNEKARSRWPEEYYRNEDIENMESRLFGDVYLNCTANAEEYLKRNYGEHWYTHGVTHEFDHIKLENVNPVSFELKPEHYQPAKPYN